MVKNRQEVLNMPRRKIPVPEPVPEKKPDPRKGVLTSRQKTFAQHVVEGVYSNSECARLAGYAAHCSNVYASKLLNGREYPHVVEYIQELREQRERRYGVTLIGQLQRLDELSRGAQDANQYSAAINAEKIRSALGGLTIDRRETINTIDQLSRDEITARLAALQKQYPQAFQIDHRASDAVYEDVSDEQGTRGELLEYDPDEPPAKNLRDAD
jgi:hypothetical protein